MRLNMKGVKVIGEEALKLVKAGYDSGMSWVTVAKQMAIRYLLEEQRANIYAQANADLFDKLTAKTLEHNTTVLDLATKLQNETIRAEQLEDKLQISNDNLAQLQKKADAIGIGKPAFPQDQLRPGDPRRDFPGGVPHTINSSAAGKVMLDSKQTASTVVVVWSTPWNTKPNAKHGGDWDIFDRFGNRVGYVASEELANFIVNGANSGALKPPSVPRIAIATDQPVVAPRLTTYDPTPESRAASDQALRRIAGEPAPGRIAD